MTNTVHDLRDHVLRGDTPDFAEFADLVRAYRADRAAAVASKQRKTAARQVDLQGVFGRAPGAPDARETER